MLCSIHSIQFFTDYHHISIFGFVSPSSLFSSFSLSPFFLLPRLTPHHPTSPISSHPPHLTPLTTSLQKSLKSPFVPSSKSKSKLEPYFFLYSALTLSKWRGSQWKRMRRLTSSSVRSLVEVSERAWWRRRASRTGRLRTPFRM